MKTYSFNRCCVCDGLKTDGVWEGIDFVCGKCRSEIRMATWDSKTEDEKENANIDSDFDELEELDLLEIKGVGERSKGSDTDGEE